MMSMTSNDWNPTDHPRERTGEFAVKTHTRPEAELPLAADDASRGQLIGRQVVTVAFPTENELDTLIANRLVTADDLAEPLTAAWGLGASGATPDVVEEELAGMTGGLDAFSERPDLNSDLVASAAEVAFYRSSSYRDDGQGARFALLGSGTLRSADFEVERRSGHREVPNDTAAILAESLLQRLPGGEVPVDFPRLAELAAFPENYNPEDTAKVESLHRELGGIYNRLQPAQRPRADALFTWSLHGADAEANPPLI